MSPILIDLRPRCPTCGHVVNVQAADEGTHYYEPDEREVAAAARREGWDAALAAMRVEVEGLGLRGYPSQDGEPLGMVGAGVKGTIAAVLAVLARLAAEQPGEGET